MRHKKWLKKLRDPEMLRGAIGWYRELCAGLREDKRKRGFEIVRLRLGLKVAFAQVGQRLISTCRSVSHRTRPLSQNFFSTNMANLRLTKHKKKKLPRFGLSGT